MTVLLPPDSVLARMVAPKEERCRVLPARPSEPPTRWQKAQILLAKIPPLPATFGSIAVAMAGWGLMFGWPRGACLTLNLLVHELGHVAAAKLLRLRVRHLLFLPFLGAVVLLREKPRIIEQDAVFALGGPACGALFAIACAMAWLATGDRLVGWTAVTGAALNLFNMIPLFPLDGGRVLEIISPHVSIAGVPMLGFLAYWRPDYAMLIIAPVALLAIVLTFIESRADREHIAFYAAPPATRACAVAAYLMTAAVLGLAFLMAL